MHVRFLGSNAKEKNAIHRTHTTAARKNTCQHCFQRSWQFLALISLLTPSSSYFAAATRKSLNSPRSHPPTNTHTHTHTVSAVFPPLFTLSNKNICQKRAGREIFLSQSFSDVDLRPRCLMRGPGVGGGGRMVLSVGC